MMTIGERPTGNRWWRLAVASALIATASTGFANTTSASFTAEASAQTTIGTAAACASGEPYATHLAASAPGPTLWWRFGETAGDSSVADASGNTNPGSVAGSNPVAGVELGKPGLPECDSTNSLQQLAASGDTGFVALPVLRSAPTTFSISLLLQADPGSTGTIATFADNITGGATTADRTLGLDGTGRLTFTVLTTTGPVTVQSSAAVTDTATHSVVATMRPGTGGTVTIHLYLDGVLVQTSTNLDLAPTYSGSWRTGAAVGASAAVRLDELAIWETTALTASDVQVLAQANHW